MKYLNKLVGEIYLCSFQTFLAQFLEQMEDLLDCSCRKLDTFASALDAGIDSDETESEDAETEPESSSD